jgi:hypothetical protein
MKEWLKSMILLVVGNSLYNVVPIWITQYLLSLPNPFYSIGTFLLWLPTINLSSFSPWLDTAKQFIGISIIGYALYLIVKMFNKR